MPFPAKTSTDAIIQSAADIIRTGGIAALSMRTLAARLGVRASSLYRHFPDRSSIEKTLANRAAEQLFERMLQAAHGLNGEKALLAAAKAYLDYSVSDKSFYEILMHSAAEPSPTAEATAPIWDFFVRLVSETTHLGDNVSGAAAVWSFLHGYTVLSSSNLLGDAGPRVSFNRGAQALIRGLATPEAEVVGSQS